MGKKGPVFSVHEKKSLYRNYQGYSDALGALPRTLEAPPDAMTTYYLFFKMTNPGFN